jgi:hypothetical protein
MEAGIVIDRRAELGFASERLDGMFELKEAIRQGSDSRPKLFNTPSNLLLSRWK